MATTTTKSKGSAAELADWPLMENKHRARRPHAVIKFPPADDPILTQSKMSPRSSRMVGMAPEYKTQRLRQFRLVGQPDHHGGDRERFGGGNHRADVTWISDIASVLQNGFDPVFVDLNPRTSEWTRSRSSKRFPKKNGAVFLTHILGYNALDDYCWRIGRSATSCSSRTSANRTVRRSRARARHVRVRLEFFVLLRPPHEHHRGGQWFARTTGFYEKLRMFRSQGMVRESNPTR